MKRAFLLFLHLTPDFSIPNQPEYFFKGFIKFSIFLSAFRRMCYNRLGKFDKGEICRLHPGPSYIAARPGYFQKGGQTMAYSTPQAIQILADWIRECGKIVFFGGAGVSTESGIPDFRSADGLYHQKYDQPPEVILSHTYFKQNPAGFFRFYREKMIYPDARPGASHLALSGLEAAGKLSAVITQNIDGLHQAAGSRKVYELHGSVLRNYCTRCGTSFTLSNLFENTDAQGIPRCSCGGIIKPDVVLYEESLDQNTLTGAVRAIQQADMLIVGGTSLAVYPAAGLIQYYRGHRLVLINKTPTPQDDAADLLIHQPLGDILTSACQAAGIPSAGKDGWTQ